MADFISMTCKSCGGKLKITPEIDEFACMYCGTEFRVKRGDGVVSLSPMAEDIKKVSISTDKTASELAIIRLKEEIGNLKHDLKNEKNKFRQLGNDWSNNRKMINDLLNDNERKRMERQRSWEIITGFVIFSSFAYILVEGANKFLNMNIGLLFLFSALLTIPVYLLITWWNPFDYLQKKAIFSDENQLTKINNNGEIIKGNINASLEVQNEIENQILHKGQEIERHKRIVDGGI